MLLSSRDKTVNQVTNLNQTKGMQRRVVFIT